MTQDAQNVKEFSKKLVDKKLLAPEWEIKAFNLVENIFTSLKEKEFYPEVKNIFKAFNECKEVKVVILGQDPYFDGSATGLAFDNSRSKNKISPSLQKILKEMDNDVGMFKGTVTDSFLGHLPPQGVLLLNTALTVELNKPGSHIDLWKPFTEEIIKYLNKQDNIVWILWGSYAKGFKDKITNTTHHIIEGTHPAARPNVKIPFEGGKYFSRCNEFLQFVNLPPIMW